ncbi:Centrosomal protein of 76 kDa [Globomyces sp. JEL0801]|nr:Centrosomal protein of 76 kDa [Globomyces sp. JEL0801]
MATNLESDRIKNLIDSHINNKDLSEVIRKVTEGKINHLKDEETIREVISSSGLIDKLSQEVKAVSNPKNVRKGSRILVVTIQKGRALVGLNNVQQFGTSRFSTVPKMGDMEPIFNDIFELNLPAKDLGLLVDIECPIHMVLTKKDLSGHLLTIGVAEIEWRKILYAGRMSMLVELKEQSHAQMTVGIIEILLETFPVGDNLSKDEINFHMSRQEKSNREMESAFFVCAKQWWNDYLQIRSSHSTRLVKIFANNEFGIRKPVTEYVSILSSRLIESPKHASRFVSLLSYEPLTRVGDSGNLEIWQHFHTFLCVKKGDVQDHCLLLCRFHLNAFVTMGTNSSNSPHMWVTSIDLHGNVIFWESLTGLQFNQKDKHHFRSIGCCFNDHSFYANIQVSDAAEKVSFKLQDNSQWKFLDVVPSPSKSRKTKLDFHFAPLLQNLEQIEKELEIELMQAIEYFRQDRLVSCVWDEQICQLMGQCLWAMENSKLAGTHTSGFTEDFQTGIKRSIPEGHSFKGFPTVFNHTHSHRIMTSLTKSKTCRDILQTKGDCVRMAVRVKIFAYCDSVLACWVMIGARCLS